MKFTFSIDHTVMEPIQIGMPPGSSDSNSGDLGSGLEQGAKDSGADDGRRRKRNGSLRWRIVIHTLFVGAA